MAKTEPLTERQQGITALRDLLYSFNIVFVGDEGWGKAYREFMEREGIKLRRPTSRQNDYASRLARLGD